MWICARGSTNLQQRLFIHPSVCREKLASVSSSLAEAREEVETWRSKAEDAREEVESLKLHLDTQHTEKPVSLCLFGLVWFVWFGLDWFGLVCNLYYNCVWVMVWYSTGWYGMVW